VIDEQPFLPFDTQELEEPRLQQLSEIPHYEKPRTDNERLLEYQFEYLVNGDEAALVSLYKLAREICVKFINKISQENPHIKHLTIEERKDKAHDAVCYMVEQYQTKRDWFVSKNYPGYLYLRVIKELFAHTKVDEIVDYIDLNDYELLEAKQEEEPDRTECIEVWALVGTGKNQKICHIRQDWLI